MVDEHEFDAVRKVAAEVFGKLDATETLRRVFEHTDLALRSMQEADTVSGGIRAFKALLFALCNAMTIHHSRPVCEAVEHSDLVSQLFDVLRAPPLLPMASDEVQKLQHGCIETLSVLLKSELLLLTQERPQHQHQQEEGSALVLDRVLHEIDSSRAMPAFAICCVNVLISCVQHLQPNVQLLSLLASLALPTVSRWLLAFSGTSADVAPFAALLQFSFTVCYHLRAHSHSHGLTFLTLALHAIEQTHSMLKHGGLKLLGALLSAEDENWLSRLDVAQIRRLVTLLESITNIDAMPECRSLAAALLRSLNQPAAAAERDPPF